MNRTPQPLCCAGVVPTSEHVAVAVVGLLAGVVDTVAGGGSLVTFLALLALGYPPVTANVSNTVGMVVPASATASYGFRRELSDQLPRLRRFGALAAAGGISGAVLLLVLPASAFRAVVPWLVLTGCLLLAVQPALTRRAERTTGGHPKTRTPAVDLTVFMAACYGGFFGAGLGVILVALLALFIADGFHRLNALKVALIGVVNLCAAVIFAVFAPVSWPVVLALLPGALVGGLVGARVARWLPAGPLRALIIVAGLVVAARLLLG